MQRRRRENSREEKAHSMISKALISLRRPPSKRPKKAISDILPVISEKFKLSQQEVDDKAMDERLQQIKNEVHKLTSKKVELRKEVQVKNNVWSGIAEIENQARQPEKYGIQERRRPGSKTEGTRR